MRRLLPMLCALAVPALAACGADTTDTNEASAADEIRSNELRKFAYVSAVIAMDEQADDLQAALTNTRTTEDGRTVLAGFTVRELEGGEHDPSADIESAYGI